MPVSKECVILLHGLARTDRSMHRLADALEKAGFFTVNYHYPSTKSTVEALAEEEIPKALCLCPKNSKIHFVTHSMGGILVRQYLSRNTLETLGRVVMLGPPNQGSEVVDSLKSFPGFKLINGPAGMQLGTQKPNLPKRLPSVDFELGVIAGSRSINLILSLILPWPNDGKVSVENTKVVGMSDHIVLPVTHPFMMRNKQVIEQVITFLKQGAFKKQNV
jgi:triacylglycerol esterase/lipase EstA (alpha/beta hydrolase family)